MITGAMSKLLGAQVLKDLQTFVSALDTVFGGFRTRADATYKLLQAPGTAFLVVAAPERDALREASYFVERLAAERMPLAGLVLNRVHGSGAARLSAERALAAAENLEGAGIVDQTAGKADLRDDPVSADLSRSLGAALPRAQQRARPHEPSQQESPQHTDSHTPEPEPGARGRMPDPSGPLADAETRTPKRRHAHPPRTPSPSRYPFEQLTAVCCGCTRNGCTRRTRAHDPGPLHHASPRGPGGRSGRAAR